VPFFYRYFIIIFFLYAMRRSQPCVHCRDEHTSSREDKSKDKKPKKVAEAGGDSGFGSVPVTPGAAEKAPSQELLNGPDSVKDKVKHKKKDKEKDKDKDKDKERDKEREREKDKDKEKEKEKDKDHQKGKLKPEKEETAERGAEKLKEKRKKKDHDKEGHNNKDSQKVREEPIKTTSSKEGEKDSTQTTTTPKGKDKGKDKNSKKDRVKPKSPTVPESKPDPEITPASQKRRTSTESPIPSEQKPTIQKPTITPSHLADPRFVSDNKSSIKPLDNGNPSNGNLKDMAGHQSDSDDSTADGTDDESAHASFVFLKDLQVRIPKSYEVPGDNRYSAFFATADERTASFRPAPQPPKPVSRQQLSSSEDSDSDSDDGDRTKSPSKGKKKPSFDLFELAQAAPQPAAKSQAAPIINAPTASKDWLRTGGAVIRNQQLFPIVPPPSLLTSVGIKTKQVKTLSPLNRIATKPQVAPPTPTFAKSEITLPFPSSLNGNSPIIIFFLLLHSLPFTPHATARAEAKRNEVSQKRTRGHPGADEE